MGVTVSIAGTLPKTYGRPNGVDPPDATEVVVAAEARAAGLAHQVEEEAGLCRTGGQPLPDE